MQLWFISDTHFGHENMYSKFTLEDGSPARPFKSAAEADAIMVERWNKLVKPSDHIYHLGDVAIDRKWLSILGLCNGHKRLIRGNHDIFKTKMYLPYFEEIYGVRVLDKIIFSHVPLARECLDSPRRKWMNVHGHTHTIKLNGPYLNICVEQTNYSPISLEEIRSRFHSTQPLC